MRISEPLALPCGAVLPNRLAKAAMSEQLAGPDGAPDARMVRLYERWGAGGAGLLITGNVMIDGRHCGERGNVAVEDDRFEPMLRRWADAGKAHGTPVWMQLNHPGRQTPTAVDPAPVAPSAVPMDVAGAAFTRPRALTPDEIVAIVERFGRTAGVARRAGFSGVQIHAAHGYLASQFLSPHTNRRTDDWGGDPERRRRFLVEVVRAVRAQVGPDLPVGVKLNSADFQKGGLSEDESIEVVQALCEEGIDLLEVSGGTYSRAVMFSGRESTRRREAYFLDFAQRVRERASVPLMLTGGFRTRAAMEEALESGAIDVVGMARPFAVEPDLPARLLDGSTEGALPVHLTTGMKTVDSMIVGAWYQHQIRRLGKGRDPRPSLSRPSALVLYALDAARRGRPARRSG